MSDVTVVDNESKSRFEVFSDGELAGFSVYSLEGDVITFIHTETFDAYAGQGLAGKLVSGALEQTRAASRRVVAQCPYVASYIGKHPEFADLLV
ncbi:MAG: GCN5-related N-acetyltransferase [Nocardioidaceae bacterium]|nr:GCN5-related N-acetyltransferase [Nocardioidaceae bacterium]